MHDGQWWWMVVVVVAGDRQTTATDRLLLRTSQVWTEVHTFLISVSIAFDRVFDAVDFIITIIITLDMDEYVPNYKPEKFNSSRGITFFGHRPLLHFLVSPPPRRAALTTALDPVSYLCTIRSTDRYQSDEAREKLDVLSHGPYLSIYSPIQHDDRIIHRLDGIPCRTP